MDASQAIRTAVYQAIDGLIYGGKVIPVFDGMVNPSVIIPSINFGSCYIILNDQQETAAPIQTMCSERILANITIKVVVKYSTSNVTDRTVCEGIADLVQKAIRENRQHKLSSTDINIQKVSMPISRNMEEFASGQTALSKVLIYSITANN